MHRIRTWIGGNTVLCDGKSWRRTMDGSSLDSEHAECWGVSIRIASTPMLVYQGTRYSGPLANILLDGKTSSIEQLFSRNLHHRYSSMSCFFDIRTLSLGGATSREFGLEVENLTPIFSAPMVRKGACLRSFGTTRCSLLGVQTPGSWGFQGVPKVWLTEGTLFFWPRPHPPLIFQKSQTARHFYAISTTFHSERPGGCCATRSAKSFSRKLAVFSAKFE